MVVGEPDQVLLHLLYVLDHLDPAATGGGEGGRRGDGNVGQVLIVANVLYGLLLGWEEVRGKLPQLKNRNS